MAIEKRKERKETMDLYTPFKEMQRMIDRLFDEFPYEWPTLSRRFDEVIAPMDIFETEKGYEIEAEIPGMKKDDIEVNVTDRVLTIKGEKSDERKEEKKGARILERSYGMFERSFTLPDDADPEKIEAKYEDGVLKLLIPKRPESKSKKVKIEVR